MKLNTVLCLASREMIGLAGMASLGHASPVCDRCRESIGETMCLRVLGWHSRAAVFQR